MGQEAVWKMPDGRAFFQTLASMRRVITFDYRGMGASQRDVGSIGWTHDVEDFDALVEHLGLESFDLFSMGSPGIAYAAKHPDKVQRLILWTPSLEHTTYPPETLATIRTSWNLFTRAAATVFLPDGSAEALRGVSDAIRSSCTPEYYLQVASLRHDHRPELPNVRCPTLVLQPEGAQHHRAQEGREVASLIPQATYVGLPGGNGAPYWDLKHYMDTLVKFLGEVEMPTAMPSRTAVILFADIVESTALTERLGDDAFRDKARELDEALRQAIRSNGGTAIDGKLLGDGVLATFGAAREAISCAAACHSAALSGGLELHVGIHAGDVIRESNNVFGGAVNIAARVASEASAGETLVSATVRELARTSAGVSFEDRGERALKGVGELVRVFAVNDA
jgi:class 3 adenylate cyclase